MHAGNAGSGTELNERRVGSRTERKVVKERRAGGRTKGRAVSKNWCCRRRCRRRRISWCSIHALRVDLRARKHDEEVANGGNLGWPKRGPKCRKQKERESVCVRGQGPREALESCRVRHGGAGDTCGGRGQQAFRGGGEGSAVMHVLRGRRRGQSFSGGRACGVGVCRCSLCRHSSTEQCSANVFRECCRSTHSDGRWCM